MVQEQSSLDALKKVVANAEQKRQPSLAEIVTELQETVQAAAALRREIVDAGFDQVFANEVAKQFLWRSLGLGE